MKLSRFIPFFVLVANNCHSAIAKDGQARHLNKESWEYLSANMDFEYYPKATMRNRKSPSKGSNPSKGKAPTRPKTEAPTPSRSKAPTVTSTSAPTPCDDDPAFTFTAPKTKITQDCAYITKNDSKLQQRQDNVCDVEENGVLVSSKCCAACTPCDDDPAFTFTAPKTKITQDCAYITKNDSKLQQRQENVCGVEENGVLVSSKCCSACTALVPPSVSHEPSPTVAPTAAPTAAPIAAPIAAPTPCDDDPAFTFTTPNTKKNKDCAYITKNDSKLQQRQENVCGVEENGVLVSSKCCAACTALVPPSVSREPSLTTVAPTAAPIAAPIAAPTAAQTAAPTVAPTAAQTAAPTVAPTAAQTAAPTVAPTKLPTVAPTIDSECDVRTFSELQGAINNGEDGDIIKLCSGTIVFTQQIVLGNRILTFTCPNGDCILDAESKTRFFLAQSGHDISFDGIAFKNGNALKGASQFDGGAIFSRIGGTVVITACTFIGNTATDFFGGAIANAGSGVYITGSKFIGNRAKKNGGAIHKFGGGIYITDSEFEENTAGGKGSNISQANFDGVACNDGNTFNNPDDNFPVGLCE
eukprot:scaffold4540_cov256-Chaetoceros_neogracile.AAC.1